MNVKKMKKCKKCNFCKRVYTLSYYRFWWKNEYYCTAREEMINFEKSCERWQKRRAEYDLSAKRFDETEENIRFLQTYFKGL